MTEIIELQLFTIKIKGVDDGGGVGGVDIKVDTAADKRICDGIYLIQIIFDKPKYFEVNSEASGISVFPRGRKGVIEIEIISKGGKGKNKNKNKDIDMEDYRIFCEGTRYIIDAILIKKSLMEIEK